MNRSGFFIGFLLMFGLGACLKVEPYTPPKDFSPSLVVHAYIGSDSQTKAWVSESGTIVSKVNPSSNASLSITNTSTGATANFDLAASGYYTLGGSMVKPGDSFAFECSHPKVSFTISEMRPHSPNIVSIDTQTRLNPFVGGTLNFDLSLKDTAALKNYYRLYVEKTFISYIYDYQGILVDSFESSDRIPIFGKELAFIQNDYNKYNTQEILFTDETFNGVREDFSFYTSDLLQPNANQKPLSIRVTIESLTAALYEFYNNRNAHLWQQNSIIQAPSAVQGNLNHVFGVVGSFSSGSSKFGLR